MTARIEPLPAPTAPDQLIAEDQFVQAIHSLLLPRSGDHCLNKAEKKPALVSTDGCGCLFENLSPKPIPSLRQIASPNLVDSGSPRAGQVLPPPFRTLRLQRRPADAGVLG